MYQVAQQCPHCHQPLEQELVDVDPAYPDTAMLAEWMAVCIDCDYSEPITN